MDLVFYTLCTFMYFLICFFLVQKGCYDIEVPDIKVPDIEVPEKYDIEVPATLRSRTLSMQW